MFETISAKAVPTPDDFKNIIDSGVKKNIQVYIPSSNTPFNIGHPCSRKLVYHRLRGQDAQPHSAELQIIFGYGAYLEEYVQERLRKDGFEVLQSQRPLKDHSYNISGKIDCALKHKLLGNKPVVCEIKTMSPFEYPKYNSQSDFLNSTTHFYKSYYAQVQSYLHLISLTGNEFADYAVIVLFNKTSARYKFIFFQRDEEFIRKEILDKCKYIDDCVERHIVPEPIDYNKFICNDCAFNHICDVNRLTEDNYELLFNTDVSDALKEMEGLEVSKKRYEELSESIKDIMKGYKQQTGKTNFLCDNYEIKITTIETERAKVPKEISKQYSVKSQSERVTIKKIN